MVMLANQLALIVLLVFSSSAWANAASFAAPEAVVIDGYDDHAMEPFLSRDGRWLFFNNRNQPEDQTDLHFAERLTELKFRYLGPLTGANSEALDGVPSMDRENRFFFVSPRSYRDTRRTLWRGRFEHGVIRDLALVKGNVARQKPLWLNIDAEISADGSTLYFAENRWRLFGGGIKSSNLLLARRTEGGRFLRPPAIERLFESINTSALEYAPAVSADQRTLYFTRANLKALKKGDPRGFGIFVAERSDQTSPFGTPHRIESVTGYAEAPTLDVDECALYFHRRVKQVFEIARVRKLECSASGSSAPGGPGVHP